MGQAYTKRRMSGSHKHDGPYYADKLVRLLLTSIGHQPSRAWNASLLKVSRSREGLLLSVCTILDSAQGNLELVGTVGAKIADEDFRLATGREKMLGQGHFVAWLEFYSITHPITAWAAQYPVQPVQQSQLPFTKQPGLVTIPCQQLLENLMLSTISGVEILHLVTFQSSCLRVIYRRRFAREVPEYVFGADMLRCPAGLERRRSRFNFGDFIHGADRFDLYHKCFNRGCIENSSAFGTDHCCVAG